MATLEEIQLPDIGDIAEVEIIEILVAAGQHVQAGQALLSVESDKASVEIPAPRAGRVDSLKVRVGERVQAGSPLLMLAPEDSPPANEPHRPHSEPASAAPSSARAEKTTADRDEVISVVLPDIGEFSEVPVVEILVAPGDHVALEQSLLTLETDKATMEIPAPAAGTVETLVVKVGDSLSTGDLILTLRPDVAHAAQAAPTRHPEPAASAPPSAPPQPSAEPPAQRPGQGEWRKAPVLPRPQDMASIAPGRKAHASPAVRRFARELGVDLALVKGSGPKGRVLKEDVQGFIKQTLTQGSATTPSASQPQPLALPGAPEVDHSRFGPIEEVELPRIRKLSGRHLHRCWVSVPHVTQFDEADITELEAFRKAQKSDAAEAGIKLTFLPFLLKAVAVALNRMPHLKASLTPDGERLILKHYTHIGVAVDTPNGLLVPVIRDVDQKGIHALARELAEIGQKARDGKLAPSDMQGGCFSISSLGGIGGTAFTPIVNAPEVAILGVSRAEMKPVWNGGEFVPRLMLPLSLSYDHRVVDGADGVRFTSLIRDLLGDIRRLLL